MPEDDLGKNWRRSGMNKSCILNVNVVETPIRELTELSERRNEGINLCRAGKANVNAEVRRFAEEL